MNTKRALRTIITQPSGDSDRITNNLSARIVSVSYTVTDIRTPTSTVKDDIIVNSYGNKRVQLSQGIR